MLDVAFYRTVVPAGLRSIFDASFCDWIQSSQAWLRLLLERLLLELLPVLVESRDVRRLARLEISSSSAG